MFDKQKIKFYGNNITNTYGPICEHMDCFVGSTTCLGCEHCLRLKARFWDVTDEDGSTWKYGEHDGYVWCGLHDKRFIEKLKKHIFRLTKSKIELKDLY